MQTATLKLGTELVINENIQLRAEVTTDMLDAQTSILRCFLPEAVSRILDVGCGMSYYFQDLIETIHSIDALDKYRQLQILKDKLEEKNKNISKIKFIPGDFFSLSESDVLWGEYDFIIFSQLFHFYKFELVKQRMKFINTQIKPGAIIQVRVHSKKHPLYESDVECEFDSFYSFDELRELFPANEFEMLLQADVVKERTAEEIEKLKANCRAVQKKDANENFVTYEVNQYVNQNNPNAFLLYVVRKR